MSDFQQKTMEVSDLEMKWTLESLEVTPNLSLKKKQTTKDCLQTSYKANIQFSAFKDMP